MIMLIFILMSGTADFVLLVVAAGCVDVESSLRCGDAREAAATVFIRSLKAL